MFKQLLVDISYGVQGSAGYKYVKKTTFNLLENDRYRYKKYFDFFMIFLIFTSIYIFVNEVHNHENHFTHILNNYVISIIFLIEYILRFWLSSSITGSIVIQSQNDAMVGEGLDITKVFKQIVKDKLSYIFSFKAIVDILAILPLLHELRLLRILMLFRVFKLFRYIKSIQTLTSVVVAKKFEFLTLFIFASIVVFVSAVLVYVMEANNPDSPINTLFDAIYWAVVTISTVGYGDVVTVSDAGRVVAMLVIVAGITVFSFTTSLIVTAFTEKLDEIKEIKLIDDISKIKEFYLVCGYENISRDVVRKLARSSQIIVVEEDEQKALQAKRDGFIALNYDPGSIESYKKLGINIKTQVKAILCLGHSDVENVYTALTIRSFDKNVYILSVLKQNVNRSKLLFAGVNEIVYDKELVGIFAREFIGGSVAFEIIHALRSSHHGIGMEEIVVDRRILEGFRKIGDIVDKKFHVVFLGIYKNNMKKFFFNPDPLTTLDSGDYLLVIGKTQFVREFIGYLHRGRK